MITQQDLVKSFINNASYYMIKFDNTGNFGKILSKEELEHVNLVEHEIHRSLSNKDFNTLFIYNLKGKDYDIKSNNIQMLIENLKEASIIEKVYRNIFTWTYDGVSIRAMAMIPSGDSKIQSTISRYGGTQMFIRVLRQHLTNISKMHKGYTPDYNFLHNTDDIESDVLALGSINRDSKMYHVVINIKDTYMNIIEKSTYNKQDFANLNTLSMKYWGREINPDFIVETRKVHLNSALNVDTGIDSYPECIKSMMRLRHKGNYNRFLIARFLLSTHNVSDAKFIYDSIMHGEEKEHLKYGDCSTQWSYVVNNLKRYECPKCSELRSFCCKSKCKLAHPLQHIQEVLEGCTTQNSLKIEDIQ